MPTPGAASGIVPNVLEKFLKEKKALTRKTYQESLDRFGRFFNLPPFEAVSALTQLNREDAELKAYEFKKWMKKHEAKPATVSVRLAALRACVKELNAVGLCAFTLTIRGDKNVLLPSRNETTDDDFEKLLKAARSLPSQTKAAQATLLLCLMALEGFRRSSIENLNFNDVDLSRKRITLRDASGIQQRGVCDVTYAALLRWEVYRGNHEGPLFPGKNATSRRCSNALWNIINRLGRKCNIEVNPNSLRQMIVDRKVIEADCDVRTIMKVLKQPKLFAIKFYQD